MTLVTKDNWLDSIENEIDAFCKLVEDKIDKQQQKLAACKKKTELDTKLAHEMKLNNELNERLNELSRRENELDRVCASFQSGVRITDGDQNRLDKAKEMYQLAKEITGIRLDFSAPSNVVKGYIRSEHKRLLQPFELCASAPPDALWERLRAVTALAGEGAPHDS